jgi:hypothetical protein
MEKEFNTGDIFEFLGHQLLLRHSKLCDCGIVRFRLSCRPHCCTAPCGVEMEVTEDELRCMLKLKGGGLKFQIGPCSECGGKEVSTFMELAEFGQPEEIYVPVRKCGDCGFSWTDWEAEEIFDLQLKAMREGEK